MAFSLRRYWDLRYERQLARVARYDEELLCANWNPDVPLLLQSNGQTEEQSGPRRLGNAAEIEVEEYLKRVDAVLPHL